MDFTLTEEQKQIKLSIKQFCKREVDQKQIELLAAKTTEARTVKDLKAAYPYELLKKLHDVGLRQLPIPAKYGGTAPENGVYQILTIACEEIGYWAGAVAGLVMIPWIFLRAIATNRYVTEEQREWIFSRYVANPRLVIATTVGEPEGGTDIHLPYDAGGSSILRVTATKDANDWIINGDKMFCSSGGASDLIMTAARTHKTAPVSQAMTFFWVPADAPGVSITPNKMMIQEFGANCQINFDHVRVPDSHLIGQVNKGYTVIESFFEAHLPGLSCFLGGMQNIYEQMRDYTKGRIGGGKPLIQHSSTASKLGEMGVNLEALRCLFYRSAWEMDQKEEASRREYRETNLFWFAASYALFKQLSWRFCEMASDIYGGLSASADLPISTFLRNIYYIRAAGLTVNTELIKAGWEYDNRYNAT